MSCHPDSRGNRFEWVFGLATVGHGSDSAIDWGQQTGWGRQNQPALMEEEAATSLVSWEQDLRYP